MADWKANYAISGARFELATLWLTAGGCKTLNALFGVAYDRSTLNPEPQLGNFWATNHREARRWESKVEFHFHKSRVANGVAPLPFLQLVSVLNGSIQYAGPYHWIITALFGASKEHKLKDLTNRSESFPH